MLLEDKTAVVTGSSSGIGRAIAMEFARQGASVIVHANQSIEAAQQVVCEIEEIGGSATLITADLSDLDSQDQFCRSAWTWRNKVDVLVNNAGIDVLTGEAAQASFENKLQLLFAVDVMATIRLSRVIGSLMADHVDSLNDPTIINVGWDQAINGMEGESGEMFGAVKSAVMGFSKSLACSLAPDVRVNCLAPGWIQTKWGDQASEFWQERAKNESLLNRWGTVEDVANAATFLASSKSSFVNGQIIQVNGGFRHNQSERMD